MFTAVLITLMGLTPERGPIEPEIMEPLPAEEGSGDFGALEVNGDVRFRFDLDRRRDENAPEAELRTRPRLRARFGATYETPLPGLSVGLRLASNLEAPGNSPHQTMDANINLSGEPNLFFLDRALIRYAVFGAHATVGKQAYPHWQQHEVFWDEDISPEGLTLGYAHDFGSGGELRAQAAWFYISNAGWRANPFRNDAMVTWQLKWSADFGIVKPTVAGTGVHMRDAAGGTVNSDGRHLFSHTDFFQAAAQVRLQEIGPVKFLVGFDFLKSTADSPTLAADPTLGFVVQGRANFDRFGLRYYYYDVEEASVPFWWDAVLAQDNFANSRGGGLTGFSGHRIQFDVNIVEGVTADLRVYSHRGKRANQLRFSETPDRAIQRYQLNLNAGF